jgi:shikimate kinase
MSGTTPGRSERIFLTGFMGSGKSTIGPILANTIGFEFMDVDRVIEENTGRSVTAIFREDGEERFRFLERGAIMELSSRVHTVVSLGGGTLTDPENFRMVTTSGILVYLKVTPDQLYHRLHQKVDRPMLTDDQGNRLSEGALRERIARLYAVREPLYARADITVMTDDKRVGVTVDQIVRKLSTYCR